MESHNLCLPASQHPSLVSQDHVLSTVNNDSMVDNGFYPSMVAVDKSFIVVDKKRIVFHGWDFNWEGPTAIYAQAKTTMQPGMCHNMSQYVMTLYDSCQTSDDTSLPHIIDLYMGIFIAMVIPQNQPKFRSCFTTLRNANEASLGAL